MTFSKRLMLGFTAFIVLIATVISAWRIGHLTNTGPGALTSTPTSPQINPTSRVEFISPTPQNTQPDPTNTTTEQSTVLYRVKNIHHELRCGINGDSDGFSKPIPDNHLPITPFRGFDGTYGEFQGFEVDFCKAIAIAIFGFEPNKPIPVRYIPVATLPKPGNDISDNERFNALINGDIDVLFRNTTWTLSRDVDLEEENHDARIRGKRVDFGPVIYHDSQRIIIPTPDHTPSLSDIGGKVVCVPEGTSNVPNMAQLTLLPNPPAEIRTIPNDSKTFIALYTSQDPTQKCDAISADDSRLRSVFKPLLETHQHVIISDSIGREPLAPAVIEGDSQWRDIVSYVIYATIYADELCVNKENISNKVFSSDTRIQHLLGRSGTLGLSLGINNDFAAQIITNLGSYEQIYNRNIGPVFGHAKQPNATPTPTGSLATCQIKTDYDIPDDIVGPNKAWNHNPPGILFSPPFL